MRVPRADWVLAVLLGLLGLATTAVLSSRVPAAVYGAEAEDAWFDYDLDEALADMTNRFSSAKSARHPLYTVLTFPPTRLLMKATGMAPLSAALVINAIIAGGCAALLYALLRAIGCRRPDAAILTLLGVVSGTGVFLYAVAEAFALGSLAILVCLLWAHSDEKGRRSPLVEMGIGAWTLGVTLSNWMFGLAAAALRRRPAQALLVALGSLGLTVGLWIGSLPVFPNHAFFLGHRYEAERANYLWAPEAGGAAQIVPAFVAHPLGVPALQVVDRPGTGRWELLSVQGSAPGSAGGWGRVAVAAWLLLLGAGLVAFLRHDGQRKFRLLLGMTLLGQLLLHLAFGYETFMYSPHWLPLLLVLAGFATLTRWRGVALALAAVCLVTAAVNNLRQFHLAVGFLQEQDALAVRRRQVEPAPAWPGDASRQIGPLVAYPGERFWVNGAPERSGGGGVWPAFDSFYIGLEVVDDSGRVVLASSDTMPGRFRFTASEAPSGEHLLRSESGYYRATWRTAEPGRWRLVLEVAPEGGREVVVVLRGIGWQFSRIKDLRREPAGVMVNRRWAVRLEPTAATVLGEEQGPDWRSAAGQADQVTSALGMGFVRLGPLPPGTHTLDVEDTRRDAGSSALRGVLAYGVAR